MKPGDVFVIETPGGGGFGEAPGAAKATKCRGFSARCKV